MDGEKDELERTKEALKRVEVEMAKMREEMLMMQNGGAQGETYALGFVPSTFMALSPCSALLWVANTLAPEMKKEMSKYPDYFEVNKGGRGANLLDFKSCVKFNQGGDCGKTWHVHTKPKKNGESGYRKELRLHCCELCKVSQDVVACHSLMTCPWLSKETWSNLDNEQKKDD